MMNSVCSAGAARVLSVRTGGAGDVLGLCDHAVCSRGNEMKESEVAVAQSMQGCVAV